MDADSGNDLQRVPLGRQIAAILRERIRTGHAPGDRLPSEVQYAKEFGVSTLTMREALAFLVQEGRIVRKRGSGTYVADRASGRFTAILSRRDAAHQNASFFFQRITRELCERARADGLPHRLYNGYGHVGDGVPVNAFGENWDDLEEAIEADEVGGVIALNADASGRWHEAARRKGLPVVGHGRVYDHSVRISLAGLVQQGVEHLHGRGCRRLALIGWGGGPLTNPFCEMLDLLGLPVREDWIRVWRHPCEPGSGYHNLQEIWATPGRKPDGLVVTDEVLFDSAVPAILSLGIEVPGDLRIVRHANKGMGSFAPFPTARLEIDPGELARGMLMLYSTLREGGPADPPHRLVRPALLSDAAAPVQTAPDTAAPQ